MKRRQRSVSHASKKQHLRKFLHLRIFAFDEGPGVTRKLLLIQRVTAFASADIPPLRGPTELIASGPFRRRNRDRKGGRNRTRPASLPVAWRSNAMRHGRRQPSR